jgi:GTP-binding protein Era
MKPMADHLPPHKAGFVAVLGKPNVGKSTLINTLLEQKVAAVSPRPQTTRKRQLGILTIDVAQVIFIDTPGIHEPRHKLGQSMLQEAVDTLAECDLVLIMVDASLPPESEDRQLAEMLERIDKQIPIVMVINKIDRLDPADLPQRQSEYTQLAPDAVPVAVSSTRGDGITRLLQEIINRLPENPDFFPADQITDLYEREIAADLIREAALLLLRDEVPHGIAVRIDQYLERGESGAYIEATLFVEREAHKGIVIGQDGAMLKQIGSAARRQIEEMSGRKIYLRLRVKVRKHWRNDAEFIRWFGYGRSKR